MLWDRLGEGLEVRNGGGSCRGCSTASPSSRAVERAALWRGLALALRLWLLEDVGEGEGVRELGREGHASEHGCGGERETWRRHAVVAVVAGRLGCYIPASLSSL